MRTTRLWFLSFAPPALTLWTGLSLFALHGAKAEPGRANDTSVSHPLQVDGTGSVDGRTEHAGLYLRLYGGFACFDGRERLWNAEINGGYSSGVLIRSYVGAGTSVGLSLGRAITTNLVVYAELVGTMVFEPSVSLQDPMDHVYQFGGGPGAAYYLSPSNVYFSATVTFPKIWFGDGTRSDFGYGVNLMAGKEWRLSADWGIGIAAQAHIANMDNVVGSWERGSGHVHTGTYALLLSATFN